MNQQHDNSELLQGDILNALEDALYRGKLGRRDFIRLAAAAGAGMASAQSMAQDGNDAAITQLYNAANLQAEYDYICLLYTSPSPRDGLLSRMPSSA